MSSRSSRIVRAVKLREDKYVGEKKNQLRHGHGVYQYDNKFFRYEGQWKNGLKHGHGKLILGDSSYYEGTFENGEIDGHGYKVFGISGATYTGQFHLGVMHGQGLMRRPNGEQYEGCWHQGQRQGVGILTGSDGSIYEGNFHQNLRHEQGVQIYSNGDQYEGDWVMDKRHGHGMLRCSDGTMYDGQWRSGVYHGEGRIAHASGVVFQGLWINGRPQNGAVRLKLAGENDVLFVEQGKTFTINLECMDEDGDVAILESGRQFKIVASVRKVTRGASRSNSRLSLLSLSQDSFKAKPKPVFTPFGYSTIPYELMQVPSACSDSSAPSPPPSSPSSLLSQSRSTSSRKVVKFDSDEKTQSSTEGIKPSTPMAVDTGSSESGTKDSSDIDKEETEPETLEKTSEDDVMKTSSSTQLELHSTSLSPTTMRKRSGSVATRSLADGSQSVVLSKSDDSKVFGSKEEQFIAGLMEPELVVTVDGKAVVRELFLPPPPAPDMSHILSTSKNLNAPSKLSLVSSASRSTSPRQRTPRHGEGKDSVASLVKSPRQSPRRPTNQSGSTISLLKSKEKLLQPKREKYCPPGTYVLIVSEVTQPPFLGSHLEDLYIEVTMVSHKISGHRTGEVSIEKLLLGSSSSRKGRASSLEIKMHKSKSRTSIMHNKIKE